MCLAIPGRILSITGETPLLREGRVDFGGLIKDVTLTFVPEATVGDHVLVHVGVAIAVIDAAAAAATLAELAALGEDTPA